MGIISTGCWLFESNKDGEAQDVYFDVVAGAYDVDITNFRFVATGFRQNIKINVYYYQGSYLVR